MQTELATVPTTPMDTTCAHVHGPRKDATDPILQGLAFEGRLGRPVASWRRTLAPLGVFYRRRGLRVWVALVCGDDGADRASVILVRSDGRGQPDLAELAVVRQDFFPFELVVRARWAVVASARVVVLEAIVPAAWEALRDAS